MRRALDALDESGFATVERVLSNSECQRALSTLRDDPAATHAHSDFMWNIRTHPNVLNAFSRVWQCPASCLLSSFDGAGFRQANDKGFVLGWHVDQNGTHEVGRVCVQGVLTLAQMNAETGGTAFIEGSHVHHESVCRRLCAADESLEEWEFVSIPKGDPALVRAREVQPSIPPGTLLLWDSRTIHRVRPPRDVSTVRAVVYLSMVPRTFAPPDVIARRVSAFNRGVPTTHWSSRFVDRGGGPVPPSRATRASKSVKRLVGFDV